MLTHYDTLRVDPSASHDQIRESYRVRLQLVHPDRHQGSSPEVIEVAEQETELLIEAFRVLSDPARRTAYDRSLVQDRAFVGGDRRDPAPEPPPPGSSAAGGAGAGHGHGTGGASARGGSYGYSSPGGGWTRYRCPTCGWFQLALPGAPEVTCERCAATFVFVTCRSCKERVPVLPTDQWSRCTRCSRRAVTPWASEETKRRRLRVQVRNAVVLLGVPLVVLAIVARRVEGSGGVDGVAYTLVGGLVAVCVGLFLVSVVVRRK